MIPITDEDIIYEDPYLIAVNKRAGDVIEAVTGEDEPLEVKVSKFLTEKYQLSEPAYISAIHRLDRRVSGLILFAKTETILQSMQYLFKARAIRKTYWAIVKNPPDRPKAKLIHWLTRDQSQNTSFLHDHQVDGGLKVQLSYQILGEMDGYYLIQVSPLTGRPHQIRVQLASQGSPIVGDFKYGFPRDRRSRAIYLHAKKLNFSHPISNHPMELQAELPNDPFWHPFAQW
ncbi:23S rRNA pseudouridine1911/1915/1917 synthase [bacterium A37T11]|nr:23S rRNA pseudouridine1911/1915/1917 synthase [bacterium A37T11]